MENRQKAETYREDITLCEYCKKELLLSKDATTYCTICDKTFCCNLVSKCIEQYHEEKECKGNFYSILNPSWRVKMVKPNE